MKKVGEVLKRLFRKFCFSLITFCRYSVAMKVDLFLALFFALLLGMLIGVDKRADFWHAVNDEEYEIWKQLVTQKFVKPVKEQSSKEKSALIIFWRPKEKQTVSNDGSSALLYNDKQVCTGFIVEIYVKIFIKNIGEMNITTI